jgi:hypothetical protein
VLLVYHLTFGIDNCSAQWIPLNCPAGGRVSCLTVSGTNIFAGTSDGVSRSVNNGINWTSVNNGLTNPPVFSSASIGSNIFAGTAGIGVFTSSNNGVNWATVNFGLINQVVRALISVDIDLYAGTDGGVFRSTNSGLGWTALNNGLTNYSVKSLLVNGSYMFAGTAGGIFRSSNSGGNWISVNSGLTNQTVNNITVNGATMFAGTEGGGVFRSGNNGTTWTAVNSGLTNQTVNAVAANGANVFAGTYGGGVFLSTNNGGNWTAVNNGLTNQYVLTLMFSGSNLFAGTAGGVFLSNNNGTGWVNKNQGFNPVSPVATFLIANNYIFSGTISQYAWRRLLSEIIGIQNISSEIPSSFSLHQNYPNPFNPVTKIRYDLPKNSFVNLVVFDARGCEVETLVNENQSAGTYEAAFNGNKLSSGVYFFKMQAGKSSVDFIETKLMLLVK